MLSTNRSGATVGVSGIVHLRRGGTSVVLDLPPHTLACVLHWGPDLGAGELGDLGLAVRMPPGDSVVAAPSQLSVLPQHSMGWIGRPGLLGSRAGRDWSVSFDRVEHRVDEAGSERWPEGPVGAVRVISTGHDEPSGLRVISELELHPSGLVRLRALVRNVGDSGYEVRLLEPALPVPAEAEELLDTTGRHAHERTPQRRPFDRGHWVRESWGGRPGHDSPTFLAAGRPAFGFRSGRVWAVHLAWSGNQVLSAEHSPTGWRLLRGGELLLPGEVVLGHGEEYASPWLTASWGEGLDELSGRFHRYLRSRSEHPRTDRPVLLNVWEAVYFDHDEDRLLDLATRAAGVGVERFVLDDGWFLGRRDDTSGLGDWMVDPVVYPDGLDRLAKHVRGLGMELGLWVEPEMVNLDSGLAREHPEWLFGTSHGPGVPSRHQHVLDLAHPRAYAHVLERISDLVAAHDFRYLKWDHNRALVDAGHGPAHTPGVHEQVRALYRMITELKARHPGLEIESCAGGGARLDLGIMSVADRAWVSDCIDAHERHRMMRWTGIVLPPEMLGAHVGSGVDHTTGRAHTLDFRAGTAVWGHLGIEWDLAGADADELAQLGAWVAFYKQSRRGLHSGAVVRADLPDPALQLDGVVSTDRTEAWYRLSALDHTIGWPVGRVPLPGLDADRRYRVTVVAPGGGSVARGPAAPPWASIGLTMSGRALADVGLQAPSLAPDQLVLLRATSVGDTDGPGEG